MIILRNTSREFMSESIATYCNIHVECNYAQSSPYYVWSLDESTPILLMPLSSYKPEHYDHKTTPHGWRSIVDAFTKAMSTSSTQHKRTWLKSNDAIKASSLHICRGIHMVIKSTTLSNDNHVTKIYVLKQERFNWVRILTSLQQWWFVFLCHRVESAPLKIK